MSGSLDDCGVFEAAVASTGMKYEVRKTGKAGLKDVDLTLFPSLLGKINATQSGCKLIDIHFRQSPGDHFKVRASPLAVSLAP